MDDNIETLLVNVIKEEDFEIKNEFEGDCSQLNGKIGEESQEEYGQLNPEIKQEPPEDYIENNTEGSVEDLGKFYEVMCEGVPDESPMEEDMQSNSSQRCVHSKEIEQLETRVGRLESLLDVLVSKVMPSPPPKPITPASSCTPLIKKVTIRDNGKQLVSLTVHEGIKSSTLLTNEKQRSAEKPVPHSIGDLPISRKGEFKTKKSELFHVPKTFGLRVSSLPVKKTPPARLSFESTIQQVSNSKQFVSDIQAKPKTASPKKPGFVLDESMPEFVNECGLVAASKAGSLSKVNMILKYVIQDVEKVGEALMVASTPEIVEALCKFCPKVVQEVDASRALFFAAESGQVGILRALLIAGVNPNACNRNSLTVLHKAASKGHEDCVTTLLQKGARVSATTNCRWTALHMAAISGAANCITALVKHGANVDEPDNMGCTALHYAARWDHHEVIQVLLDKGANPKFKNLRGKSPISFSHSETVTQMLTANRRKETVKRTNESQPGSSKKLKHDVQLVKLNPNGKLTNFHTFESTISIPDRK